jgi:8-oxo-dGTP diphosphatase
MMQCFVNGFMFSVDKKRVALIEKRQPAWQAGHHNGIGGKTEPGESSIDAMVREFAEETGVLTQPDSWRHFVTLSGDDFVIDFYCCISPKIDAVRTIEAEETSIHPVDMLPDTVLHNLRWLIPMALDEKLDFNQIIQITEK